METPDALVDSINDRNSDYTADMHRESDMADKRTSDNITIE
jgi:hypothetical protein